MNPETTKPITFSSSFVSKLLFFLLGIGCFCLLGSGEMSTFIASKVQADFFIPPFLFKILLFLFGISFFLMIFSTIKINRHGISTSFLLIFIEPIAWENIEKIKIEQMRVKKQQLFQIHIFFKKNHCAQRRILWFFTQKIDQWSFSWPANLTSKKMTLPQALEKYARENNIPVFNHSNPLI